MGPGISASQPPDVRGDPNPLVIYLELLSDRPESTTPLRHVSVEVNVVEFALPPVFLVGDQVDNTCVRRARCPGNDVAVL